MNSPRAKFTMPVIPNVSVIPSAMMPYMAPMIAPLRTWPRTSCVTDYSLARVRHRPPPHPTLSPATGERDDNCVATLDSSFDPSPPLEEKDDSSVTMLHSSFDPSPPVGERAG